MQSTSAQRGSSEEFEVAQKKRDESAPDRGVERSSSERERGEGLLKEREGTGNRQGTSSRSSSRPEPDVDESRAAAIDAGSWSSMLPLAPSGI